MELNAEQQQIVQLSLNGNVFALAGAGSGKTETITRRIVALLTEHGIPSNKITVTTFTRAAADILRDRVQGQAGAFAQNINVGTFHHLAAVAMETTDPLIDQDENLVYYCKAVERGDIWTTALMVDEVQDLHRVQQAIIAAFMRHGAQILLVGDDSQMLYAWLGCRVSNMSALIEAHGCQVVYLNKNYRSNPQIVELANRCARANKQPDDPEWQRRKPPMEACARFDDSVIGSEVALFVEFPSLDFQIFYIVKDLVHMVRHVGILPHHIAILCRAGWVCQKVAVALMAAACPSSLASQERTVQPGRIQILTSHSSKGTEFDVVYIVDCSSSSMPDIRSPSIEDDRRLFYVSLTRPKKFLRITYMKGQPSMFLTELMPANGEEACFLRVDGETTEILPPWTVEGQEEGETPTAALKRQFLERQAKRIVKKRFALEEVMDKMDGEDIVHIKTEIFPEQWRDGLVAQLEDWPGAYAWPAWAEETLRPELVAFYQLTYHKMLADAMGLPFNNTALNYCFLKKPRGKGVSDLYTDGWPAYTLLRQPQFAWRQNMAELWTLAKVLCVADGRMVSLHVDVSSNQLEGLARRLENVEATCVAPLVGKLAKQGKMSTWAIGDDELTCEMNFRFGDAFLFVRPRASDLKNDSLIRDLIRVYTTFALARTLEDEPPREAYIVDLFAERCIHVDFQGFRSRRRSSLLAYVKGCSTNHGVQYEKEIRNESKPKRKRTS